METVRVRESQSQRERGIRKQTWINYKSNKIKCANACLSCCVVCCPSPSFLSSNCLIPDGAPLVPRGLGSLSESVGVRERGRERECEREREEESREEESREEESRRG